MKTIFTYLIIFTTSLFLFNGCDKPAPTEFFDDVGSNEILEYEVLTSDLTNQYATSGLDTSGIIQDINGLTNLISVSGIKISTKNRTDEFSLAQCFFFDRSQPVYYSNQQLLGYRTIIPGIIKFNGEEARIVPYRIRYREQGMQKDTLLGNKYALYNINGMWGDPFNYVYHSQIEFNFTPFNGQPVNFNIQTPNEITGSINLNGSRSERNLGALIEWNAGEQNRITIIMGLIRHGHLYSIPVYRFRTRDDGRLIIPKRFLNELPLNEFDKIVFTLVRSFEHFEQYGENNLFVSSQSIHSIVIDIP